MDFLLGVLLIGGIVAANVIASVRAIRYDGSTKEQEIIQLALVWVLPILGAVLVLIFTRQHTETSSGHREGAETIWDDLPVNHERGEDN